MKKLASWLFATVGAIVLLFSYKTSTEVVAAAEPQPAGATVGAQAPAVSPGPTGPTMTDGTFAGAGQDTKYGPVQVQITVVGGKVTAAKALLFPSGKPRTDEINADAVPRLEAETVGTVDGKIDMVTGATFTSTGYLASLQDALDQARA